MSLFAGTEVIKEISGIKLGSPLDEITFYYDTPKKNQDTDLWGKGELFSATPQHIQLLELMGTTLLEHNVQKLLYFFPWIKKITLPKDVLEPSSFLFSPELKVEVSAENVLIKEGMRSILTTMSGRTLFIPRNAAILTSGEGEPSIECIIHPWDILKVAQSLLASEIKGQKIANTAKISKTAIIDGPCIIGDGVEIDDYAKIKGPCYIGPYTKIGTGSLIRHSVLGRGSTIGFNCEVGRSILLGYDTVPHMDVILDTLMGEYTWMGAFVGTTNVMFDGSNVKYKLNGELIDTGLKHFGMIMGHHCNIGAGAIFLPGRYLPPHSFIPPNAVFSSIEKQSIK